MLRTTAAVIGHRTGFSNDRYASDSRHAGQIQEGHDLIITTSLILVNFSGVIISRKSGIGSVNYAIVIRVVDLDQIEIYSATVMTTDRLQVGELAKT